MITAIAIDSKLSKSWTSPSTNTPIQKEDFTQLLSNLKFSHLISYDKEQ